MTPRWYLLAGAALLACCARRQPALTLTECRLPQLERPARCGTLDVFENRESKSGRVIKLRVAVLPPKDSASRAAPLFLLVGGPGQSAVDNAAGYAALFAPLRATRALVFVDQRGTGASNPLPCDLHSGQPSGLLGDFLPLEAVRACRTTLERGADLRFYSSELAAEDLDDVRAALGFTTIDIEAASYGTRVALVYLRRHSPQVRSVVLRSVSPPWVKQPLHFAEDAQAAFDSLAEACLAETSCHATFPRFRANLDSVLARLAVANVTVLLPGADSAAPKRNISLSRGAFAEKVRLMLYAPEIASLLPLLIERAAAGDYHPFAELADDMGQQIAALASNGMYLSVTCAEDVAQITPAEASQSWPGTFLGDYRVKQQKAACALWPESPLPADFAAPIHSAVPVLLISSTSDPITPPHWAEQAAKDLSNSRHLLVPNAGHSPSNRCVISIEQQFILSASAQGLDVACLSAIRRPAFAHELPD